ncbi:hypothetical protein [Thermococcus sp.]|uniref:hypothetical protein n=1 Tax=Thermococcus sp. TaxID=35749 RepID=UPI0026338E8B|nr:hypothetical protein [Thermococcus sp.]
MDPLEHAPIPSLVYLALSPKPSLGFLMALVVGAVFPGLDVLTGEHCSYLHSLLFLPALVLAVLLGGYHLAFASAGSATSSSTSSPV